MATTANNWIAASATMTPVKYSANTSAPVIYSSAFNYTQVIPAKAGIHVHYSQQQDCGIRRNDGGEVFSQHFGSSNLQLCIQLQTGHPGEGRDPWPLQPITGLRHSPQ
jgi:hypothetical protein